MVRFHDGFLFTSYSLVPAFFPALILDYAMTHTAIVVNPNYLKLPESNGLDDLRHIMK